jgi:hypothetical protein
MIMIFPVALFIFAKEKWLRRNSASNFPATQICFKMFGELSLFTTSSLDAVSTDLFSGGGMCSRHEYLVCSQILTQDIGKLLFSRNLNIFEA